MRRGMVAATLVAGLLLIGPALSQQPGRGGRGGGGFGFGGFGAGLTFALTTNKPLQDELKVDQDQVTKLNDALAKVRTDLADDMAKLRDQNATQEDRTKIFKKMADANEKAVETVLKPDQVKRLHQIENQQAGLRMFDKDNVKTALKLTDEQKEKIKGINDDLTKDLRDLNPNAGNGGRRRGRGGNGGGGGFGFGVPAIPRWSRRNRACARKPWTVSSSCSTPTRKLSTRT